MRRHYRSAQRLGALCLCLALCVGMLYLCERTIAFAESPVEEGEQAPDEGVFDLWDPSITAELTAMPPEAFDEPTARLAGFSPDGRKALISYCSESYLYDLETGERTALRIGDDMTVEALRAEAQYQLYGLSEEKAAEVLHEKEIDILITLGDGAASATAWGCDLTYDYVKINGDYRT